MYCDNKFNIQTFLVRALAMSNSLKIKKTGLEWFLLPFILALGGFSIVMYTTEVVPWVNATSRSNKQKRYAKSILFLC